MKTPNDWQNFSQKKDIEEIKEGITTLHKSQNTFMKRSLISIILTIVSAVISGIILSYWDKSTCTIAILCTVIVLFSLAPFYKSIFLFIFKGNQSIQNDPGKIIDLFDNETIYYIMMSKSFLEYKKEINLSDAEKELYGIEAKYYLDKAVSQLAFIEANQLAKDEAINNLLYNTDIIDKNKYISYDRMNNTLKLIAAILKIINDESFTTHISTRINTFLDKWTTDKNLLKFEL